MKCSTVKRDQECFLASSKGCTANAKQCYPVIKACSGCDRIENDYCRVYANPEVVWEMGYCPMNTHTTADKAAAKKANPLKASKKAHKASTPKAQHTTQKSDTLSAAAGKGNKPKKPKKKSKATSRGKGKK
jgi:hypothetical protein